MNTHFARRIGLLGLLGFMGLTTLPVWAEAVESEASVEPDTQRAACDARCREDYQSNAAALQACLRDCGAIGPASAGAISAGHEATHTVQQAGTAKTSPAPAEAVNLNSSKSNRFSDQAVPGTGGPTPAQTTTVKGSKSNSDNRNAVPRPPTPAETSNLNLSKSNINREVETEASDALKSGGVPATGATPSEEPEDDATADR